MSEREPGFGTRSVHDAQTPTPVNAPPFGPIYQSAGWTFTDLEQVDAVYERAVPGAIYGSDGNPNLLALEAVIASLEGAGNALATSAGMAAFAAAFLSLLRTGDRVVAAQALYGNTVRLL